MNFNPHLMTKVRSKAIMRSAKGQGCTLRIASFLPGHQCSGNDTTVMSHLPVGGKGTGTKVTDLAAVYCCHNCHAILDGVDTKAAEYIAEHYPAAAIARQLNGLIETQSILIDDGLIVVPGAKLI